MPQSNLTPLSVVDYKEDYIINFVRHKTGWSERNEVSKKTQLIYLNRYLKDKSIDCKTIVAEDEYIDRHFLEDYAEYYARCFPAHPRECSRLHFFSSSFDEHGFKEALSTNNAEFIKALQEHYLGFAVIRPIPHTFFAKLCLQPYDSLISKQGSSVLRKTVSVSLFGVNLSVQTIPFIEQDKVVSACATSAIWTALSATSETQVSHLPSPSAITKSATHLVNEGSRVFPTTGLTPPQVARSLSHYGLAPIVISLPTADYMDTLKEQIYAYISNETPLILGGDVYEKQQDEVRHLGRHLVCVVGYNVPDSGLETGCQASSKAIDKIYIHDDRIGPFIKVKTGLNTFKSGGKEMSGLTLKVDTQHDNYFIPNVLIIGLNHKVRISYDQIRAIRETFETYLNGTSTAIGEHLKTEVDPQLQGIHDSLQMALKGVWDISLITSTRVKEELRHEDAFMTFNGVVKKTSLLLKSLPKHIWRCRLHTRQDDKSVLLTDLLFDATEIPQGRLMVGYISYSTEAQTMWVHVNELIKNRLWQRYETTAERKSNIGCVVKFFNDQGNSVILNTTYGPLGLPRRELKYGEKDEYEDIPQRTDVHTIRAGSHKDRFNFLLPEKKYIWVINEMGDIVIGEDVNKGEDFQGHPTLIDGKPGRIAGELFKEADTWKANLKSRAYSGHVKPGSEEYDHYLKQVVSGNLAQIDCQIAAPLV
nr:hypothetical protein [uncultured Rhodoferax sp.]